jgi:hypothetical protein
MTDRELLEAAAKAAGNGFVIGYWNPLTDDGDALRLAVKLGIDLTFYLDAQGEGPWVEAATDDAARDELLQADPYAATRRAIVRAAAEIGRSKT